jgi:hypothetical protein
MLPAVAAATAATAAEVKAAITGRIDLTADRGRKVFIEFPASPKLTAAARFAGLQRLRAGGHPRTGDVVYELDGAFQALRPATRRTAEVRVGDYAENPHPWPPKAAGRLRDAVAEPAGHADRHDCIQCRECNRRAGLGERGTVGDPDGKCLSRCETWRYRQRNVVNLTRKEGSTEQKCSVLATAEDAELVPARLIQSSLAGLQEAAGLIVALGLSADPALAK